MGIYPVYSYVALTTGERAIVSVINSGKLHQPIVTITHDPLARPYIVPLVIDLANQDGAGSDPRDLFRHRNRSRRNLNEPVC